MSKLIIRTSNSKCQRLYEYQLCNHIISSNHFRKHVNSFRSNINAILNLFTLHKPILIRRNDYSSHKCKPICQYFGNNLKFEISNNNWPIIFNGVSTLNLRNKRYHIIVHSRGNPVLFKKLLNNIANIYPNNVPARMIENTTKTIRTMNTITIKIKNNNLDFQKNEDI